MIANASNETAKATFEDTICKLPPLILHPFSDPLGPAKLIESSRASLKMQGLLPTGESTREDLDGAMLEGRFSELRMLYYVGKDINRWIEQCLDCVRRTVGGASPAVPAPALCAQSFTSLLIQNTPAHIREKLQRWGVSDYRALFSRGIGLNVIFATVPERAALSEDFVRNYYRYSDQLFSSYQTQTPHPQLSSARFHFDLYSSGEYSRMLERSWDMP